MGLGVLDDKHLEAVPGTAIFTEDPNAAALAIYQNVDIHTLKKGTGRSSDIILVPQPSDDPNDPLNAPASERWLNYFVLFMGTVIVGIRGPLLAADQPNIAAVFGVDVQQIGRVLGSYITLTLAISTILMAPIATKFGRRPVFLGATVCLIAGTVGASFCNSVGPFLGCTILSGIGIVLGWRVNQRALRAPPDLTIPVALWNVALLEGIALTPPIAGQILQSETLGWRWALRLYAIVCIPLLIAQYLFSPETRYIRKVKLPVAPGMEDKAEMTHKEDYTTAPIPETHDERHIPTQYAPKKTFVQRLAIFSGVYPTRNNFLSLMLQPFYLILTPALVFGAGVYGLGITWLVVLATAFALLFSADPYNFNASQSGLVYLSSFVANLLALGIAGPIQAWITKTMSKKNGGIYEPEFKLPMIIGWAIFGVGGLLGFGLTLQAKLTPMVPIFFFGMISFGLVLSTSAVVSYVIDVHRNQSDSAVAALIFWKNMLSFALTWNIVNQILGDGLGVTFGWVAGLTFGCTLFTIPMYIYGKRLRSFVFRKINLEGETEMGH